MADPSVVSNAGAALSTNDPSVTFPGGYTPLENDVIALFISSTTVLGAVANASLPAGWVNPLGDGVEINSDAHGMACLYHLVTAAEETAVTLTYTATDALDATETGYVQAVAVRNVDSTTPIDGFNTAFNSGNTTDPHVLAGITGSGVLATGSLVVSSVAKDGTGAYGSTPTGWTQVRADNTNNGRWIGTRDALTTADTDVTATNITPSAGDEYCSITLAFKSPNVTVAVPVVSLALTIPVPTIDDGQMGATMLASNFDNIDRTTGLYVSSSISPAPDSFLICFLMSSAATTAPTVSPSGLSLSWSSDFYDLDGGRSYGIYTAQCGASPGSGTVAFSWSDGDPTITGCGWFIIQVTRAATSGTVVQTKLVGGDGATNTAATEKTGTLDSAIADAANRVFCVWQYRLNETVTPRANWEELGTEFVTTGPNNAWECQWRHDGTNEQTYGSTIATGGIRFAGLALEVKAATGDIGVSPAVVSLALTVPAPTISLSATVTTDAVAPVLTIPTPTSSASTALTPTTVAPTLTIPEVTIGADASITPAVVPLAFSIPAPSISAGVEITTTAVQPTLTIPAPTVAAGAEPTPAAVSLALTIPAPSISADATVALVAVQLVLTTPAPAVTMDAGATPEVVPLALTVPTPTAAATVDTTPSTVPLALTIPTPSISADVTITLVTVGPTLTIPSATIAAAANVTTDLVPLALTVPTPSISADVTITVAAISPTLTVPAPAVTIDVVVLLNVVSPILSIPAPSISADVSITSDVVPLGMTIPVPSVSAGGNVNITVDLVTLALTVPDPSAAASATTTPATVPPALVIPIPSITSDTSVTVATITATLTIPLPVPDASVIVTQSTIALFPTIPTPAITAGAGATATPAAVQPTLALPAPMIQMDATAAAALVLLALAIFMPLVTTPSNVTVSVYHSLTRYAHPGMRTYVSRG